MKRCYTRCNKDYQLEKVQNVIASLLTPVNKMFNRNLSYLKLRKQNKGTKYRMGQILYDLIKSVVPNLLQSRPFLNSASAIFDQ